MRCRSLSLLALAWLVAAGCGGADGPPKRRVLERDLDAWSFGRYQRVVDVEVHVAGNPAVAHTASYARTSAQRAGRLGDDDVVNAFVTEYERDAGILAALVKFARRLAQEAGYTVEEKQLGGQRVISVVGHGEAWALWATGRYLVKVGGRGLDQVPSAVVEAYGEPYPSRLPGGALEGAVPSEPEAPAPAAADRARPRGK
jgi:hypothetical protein